MIQAAKIIETGLIRVAKLIAISMDYIYLPL